MDSQPDWNCSLHWLTIFMRQKSAAHKKRQHIYDKRQQRQAQQISTIDDLHSTHKLFQQKQMYKYSCCFYTDSCWAPQINQLYKVLCRLLGTQSTPFEDSPILASQQISPNSKHQYFLHLQSYIFCKFISRKLWAHHVRRANEVKVGQPLILINKKVCKSGSPSTCPSHQKAPK